MTVLLLTPAFAGASPDPLAVSQDAEMIVSKFHESRLSLRSEKTVQMAMAYDKALKRSYKPLSVSEKTAYLKTSKVIPTSNSLIQSIAARLTVKSTNEIEKLLVLHNFVLWRVSHVAFFHAELKTAQSLSSPKGRILQCQDKQWKESRGKVFDIKACGVEYRVDPGHDIVLESLYSGLGNCATYAGLFASLARAIGVPTRVITKQLGRDTHIWTEVYLGDRWLVVDPTYDDKWDIGTYVENSLMKLDFTFFLVSAAQAGRLAPKFHRDFEISDF